MGASGEITAVHSLDEVTAAERERLELDTLRACELGHAIVHDVIRLCYVLECVHDGLFREARFYSWRVK